MYCRNCGTQVPDNAVFCKNCGKRVSRSDNTGSDQQPVIDVDANPADTHKASKSLTLFAKPNVIGLIASVAIGMSVFFPFISTVSHDVIQENSLIDGVDGVIFLIVAAAGLLFSAFGRNIAVLATGTFAMIGFFIDALALKRDLQQLLPTSAQKGSGYFLLAAGAAVLLFAGAVGTFMKKKE